MFCWWWAGCLSPPQVVPAYFRRQIGPGLSLDQLRVSPSAFTGRKVLLGGIILNVQNYPLNTELEIMEKPLDRRDIPVKTGYSSGRFLGIYDGYLDRLIYAPGRLITVGGEFAGLRKEDRLGMTYVYPVIKIQFFQLWPSHEPYYYPTWFRQRGKETEKAPPFWD